MVRRIASLLLLGWMVGFIAFAVFLPRPAGAEKTDGIVVLTGGEGRIARALDELRQGHARRLLVSGVDREVKPGEFAAAWKVEKRLMACCITLGFEAVDTRSNAAEAASWVAEEKLTSIRLVTTDWHMRRAAFELERVLPGNVTVIEDAVPSQPGFRALVIEYHKLLARRISGLWGA